MQARTDCSVSKRLAVIGDEDWNQCLTEAGECRSSTEKVPPASAYAVGVGRVRKSRCCDRSKVHRRSVIIIELLVTLDELGMCIDNEVTQLVSLLILH